MGERNAENADLAVEELKRKARRRLVGAIVLALAAAIILPLLLEREPKPLGDDVSVQIPPVDEGKFVNRLTGRASETKPSAKAATKNETRVEPTAESKSDTAAPGPSAAVAPARPHQRRVRCGSASDDSRRVRRRSERRVAPPKKSVSQAEQRVLSPANKPANKPDADARGAVEDRVRAGDPAHRAGAGNAPRQLPLRRSPRSRPRRCEDRAGHREPDESRRLCRADRRIHRRQGRQCTRRQVEEGGAASTYIEPVQTSRGTLWRVRVGGYSRAGRGGRRARQAQGRWLERHHRDGEIARRGLKASPPPAECEPVR